MITILTSFFRDFMFFLYSIFLKSFGSYLISQSEAAAIELTLGLSNQNISLLRLKEIK